jgi:Tol biopolymer transport system component
MAHRAIVTGLISLALAASTASAQVVRQLTDLVRTDTTLAALDDAGTVAYAISNTDPYGTNPDHLFQIFRWDPVTGDGEQVTSFPLGVNYNQWGPYVSDDGTLLVFASCSDLTGGNPDGSVELFAMHPDGTGKVQLTDTPSDADVSMWFYALSGDGSRVVFSSDADYLGTNTQRATQIWVIDTDGTGLAQLTSAAFAAGYWPTISDDGQRIAFVCSEDLAGTGNTRQQVFVILADGSGLQQLTSFDWAYTQHAQISGDGSTITFMTTASLPPGGCDGDRIAVVNWDGTDAHLVASPCIGAVAGGYVNPPDITDDGQVIFYPAYGFGFDYMVNYEIFRVNKDGTGWAQLTDTDDGPGPRSDCWASRAAGGGGRVAFFCNEGEAYGGPNPDLSNELFAMSGTGTSHLQLSDGVNGDSWDPDITPDGSRIVFASDANPSGDTGYWFPQIYRMAPDGSDVVRITSFTEGTPEEPSVTDDGGTIAFTHDGDPLGTNPYRTGQIFVVGADGTGLTQLTPYVGSSSRPSDEPHFSGDGSLIVFRSWSNILGDNLYGYPRIYKVEPDGSNLARLSPDDTQQVAHPRVDSDGTWAVYVHANAVHRKEIAGAGEDLVAAMGDWPDISADGGLVVYSSTADPLGTNPESNEELFLWNAQTTSTVQLTTTASGSNLRPRFSGDGQYVYFYSDSPHFGEDHAGWAAQFRVSVGSQVVERVGGLISCMNETTSLPYPISVDATGRRAVFASYGDCAGINLDWSEEIVAIDRLASASIRVSPGPAPTTVEWDVESGPVRYDVIRGDVASLGFDSGNVDLGAVVCVEDDSTDASTVGSEDLDTPTSGQVFFYLYRGTQGMTDGPGSYGTASSGEERMPASGGC